MKTIFEPIFEEPLDPRNHRSTIELLQGFIDAAEQTGGDAIILQRNEKGGVNVISAKKSYLGDTSTC